MAQVVGVVFKNGTKTYYFDPGELELSRGDRVVVQTMKGTEIGQVVDPPHFVEDADLPAPLKKVTRLATGKDLETVATSEGLRREALAACRELIAEHGLDMKLVNAEVMFGGEKITFNFYAEERIDFRALVADLAKRLKMRIELRQIGAREEARAVGGLGPCGRHLCCTLFPGDEDPVSIRMAKEQNLPLNPMKISGLCGRLMCCLKYEQDQYVTFRKEAPNKGTPVTTERGNAVVIGYNVPKDAITVRFEDGGVEDIVLATCHCECKGGPLVCTAAGEVGGDEAAENAAWAVATGDGGAEAAPARADAEAVTAGAQAAGARGLDGGHLEESMGEDAETRPAEALVAPLEAALEELAEKEGVEALADGTVETISLEATLITDESGQPVDVVVVETKSGSADDSGQRRRPRSRGGRGRRGRGRVGLAPAVSTAEGTSAAASPDAGETGARTAEGRTAGGGHQRGHQRRGGRDHAPGQRGPGAERAGAGEDAGATAADAQGAAAGGSREAAVGEGTVGGERRPRRRRRPRRPGGPGGGPGGASANGGGASNGGQGGSGSSSTGPGSGGA